MKSVIPTIRAILAGTGPVTTIVPAGKIHWNFAPQDSLPPDIILKDVSKIPRGNSLGGSDGPWTVRVSVECRGATVFADADALGEVVLAALHNLRGVFGGVTIQECTVVGDVPFWEDTSDVRSRIIDFRITYL